MVQSSIARKVGAPLLLTTCGGFVALGVFYWFLSRTADEVHFVSAAGRQRMLSQQLYAYAVMVRIGQEDDRQGLRGLVVSFDQALEALERGGQVGDDRVRPAPFEVQDEIADVRRLWAELKDPLLVVANEPVNTPRARQASVAVESTIPSLTDESNRVVVAYGAWSQKLRRRTLLALVAIAGFDLTLFFVSLGLTRRKLVRPIQLLDEAARRIEEGNFDVPVAVTTRDELATLARTFNQMSARIGRLLKDLGESEERYRDLFEHANDLIQSVAPDGSFLYVNQAWRAALGYTEQEVASLSVFDVVHPDSKAHCMELFQRVMAGDAIPRVEVTFVTKDGRAIVAEGNVNCSIKDGRPVATRAIFRDVTERRRTEAALRESQAQLQLISDNVADLVAQISLDGTYVYVSPSFETVLGYSSQGLIGTSAFANVHPADLERVQAAFADAIQQGMGRVEFRYRHVDGRYVWVDTLGRVVIDEAGAPSGAVLSTRDVTERKQSEDQQRQFQERFETIFDEAPLGMALIDSLTGSIDEANARFAEIAGRTRAEMTTIDWMSITYPDDVQEDLSKMAMMNAGKIPGCSMARRYRRPDGSDVWINMTIAPLAAEDTAHPRHVCMIEDITERRQTDEARRLQSAALHAAADAIVITDRAGVIEWINPAFTRLTGYTAEEALGKNPRDLVKSGKHAPAFYQEFWETILAGRTWHSEMINRRKDGSLYTEDQTVTPILDASGAITHFIAIKEDMTERLQLEAQFRQAQKMESVGQLASGIAHDFNNLLTVINGMSDLVLAHVSHDDPVHADVQEILHAGERAATLTRQLLAFSRQQILEPRVLNVNTVVAGMEELLRRLLGEDIDLVVALTPGVGHVKVDPGQIEQVITNLAVNARDAMPQGGRLTIETQCVSTDRDYARQLGVTMPSGSYVLLVVSDSGAGMDEATRARIFEPFFTTKGPGQGTGLGLSTVYGIVKQSQAFIWVYSEVGQGTSFKIYLPQVTEAVGTDQPKPTVVSSSGTETILLVEDNTGLRKLATRLLTPAGYTVLGAASGEAALLVLERHKEPVHLLLTDVVMPGMSGRHLAEHLAQTRPEMKVLYMSGYTSDTMVRHGVLEAKVSFLNKPFTAAALLRKVREVLDSEA